MLIGKTFMSLDHSARNLYFKLFAQLYFPIVFSTSAIKFLTLQMDIECSLNDKSQSSLSKCHNPVKSANSYTFWTLSPTSNRVFV